MARGKIEAKIYIVKTLTQAQAGACGLNVDTAVDLTKKEDESPAE